jgi:hypothetical protein
VAFPADLDNLRTDYANDTEAEDEHPAIHNATSDAVNRTQAHLLDTVGPALEDHEARLTDAETGDQEIDGRLGFAGSDVSLGDYTPDLGDLTSWSIEGDYPYLVLIPTGGDTGSGLELRSKLGYDDPLVGFIVEAATQGVALYSEAGAFLRLSPDAGGAGKAGLLFGPLLDIGLFRDSEGLLKTDGSIEAAGTISAENLNAYQDLTVGDDLTVVGTISGPTIDGLNGRLDVVEGLVVASALEAVVVDEKFLTDPASRYTEASGTGDLVWDNSGAAYGQEYVRLDADNRDLFVTHNDAEDSIRNPLVVLEVQSNNGGGTPIVNVALRRQADRRVEVQMHGTNIHIYTTGPTTGAGQLRANTFASWANHRRSWLVAGIVEDFAFGYIADQPPLALFMGGFSATARVTYSLSGLADFNTDASRVGKANQFRLAGGTSDYLNHRVYRHQVINLDKSVVGL